MARWILSLVLSMSLCSGLAQPVADAGNGEFELMIRIKAGVDARGIQPEINLAITIAGGIYKEYGYDTTITSLKDGKHGEHSLHQRGGICRAVDLRTKHVQRMDLPMIVSTIKDALGAQYDVKLEQAGLPNEHLHLEFDPKPQPTTEI